MGPPAPGNGGHRPAPQTDPGGQNGSISASFVGLREYLSYGPVHGVSRWPTSIRWDCRQARHRRLLARRPGRLRHEMLSRAHLTTRPRRTSRKSALPRRSSAWCSTTAAAARSSNTLGIGNTVSITPLLRLVGRRAQPRLSRALMPRIASRRALRLCGEIGVVLRYGLRLRFLGVGGLLEFPSARFFPLGEAARRMASLCPLLGRPALPSPRALFSKPRRGSVVASLAPHEHRHSEPLDCRGQGFGAGQGRQPGLDLRSPERRRQCPMLREPLSPQDDRIRGADQPRPGNHRLG